MLCERKEAEDLDLHAFTCIGHTKDNETTQIYKLNKGGIHVMTRLGPIQYGIPPESIKDSINQGLEVPEYFIIAESRFDFEDGISLMEFEFPVYFNFFLRKQRKTKIICDRSTEAQIRLIFQETLLGPRDFSKFSQDFAEGYKARPDIERELAHFARNPFVPGEPLTVDLLIEFVLFDRDSHAVIEGVPHDAGSSKEPVRVRIVRKRDNFYLYENNIFLAEFRSAVTLDKNKFSIYRSLENTEEGVFEPPAFGITVLGNSHGFDSSGSTSGFIIWVGRRGILVDPPPYSSRALKQRNIPPNLIEKIIITHCHADHDSGAFHKIIESTPVEFITSQTILNSFLRKYSAIINTTPKEVASLFQYRTAIIGHPTYVCGARFIFEYSFHSIPTLCFEVEYRGKRFFYSGDTFFDPSRLRELYEAGLFSRERYERLAHRRFEDYDLIFHEAGIAPIHTPLSVLRELPAEVRKKLYLVHIAEKDIPLDSDIKSAGEGLSRTHVLISSDEENKEEESTLDLLCSLEILAWIPFNRITEVLECFTVEKYQAGEYIVKEGTKGAKFYIVKRGTVRIFSDSPENSFSKVYMRGDFFGESVLSSSGSRLANIVAKSDIELLVISKYDFIWIFKYQLQPHSAKMNPLEMINRLAMMRRDKGAEFINNNRTVERMTENQKSMLNMFIEEVEVEHGSALWTMGKPSDACYFIKTGSYQIVLPSSDLARDSSLKPGSLIGDFDSLIKGVPAMSTAFVIESGTLYKISRIQIGQFFKLYPGFEILCRHNFIIR